MCLESALEITFLVQNKGQSHRMLKLLNVVQSCVNFPLGFQMPLGNVEIAVEVKVNFSHSFAR